MITWVGFTSRIREVMFSELPLNRAATPAGDYGENDH